jgi:SAM-dependent methyltransferase
MPITQPFEEYTERYEDWFEEHDAAYQSELAAVRELLPVSGRGLEIGVGSGRFADPLGVDVGVDPAANMLAVARERGIAVVRGVAEQLPFRDGAFDYALVVTTICFVEDVAATLAEARRTLGPGGQLVVGFVDRTSPLGRTYQEKAAENPFYRDATFLSTADLQSAMREAGFGELATVQTIFTPPDELESAEPVRDGHDEGSFVVVRGTVV